MFLTRFCKYSNKKISFYKSDKLFDPADLYLTATKAEFDTKLRYSCSKRTTPQFIYKLDAICIVKVKLALKRQKLQNFDKKTCQTKADKNLVTMITSPNLRFMKKILVKSKKMMSVLYTNRCFGYTS